ncbi:hypothetical protein A7K94_0216440, partial [Modestobacter sp. VKM Ac-2676]
MRPAQRADRVATRICDASSNTTKSNRPARAGKNRATESGLTSTHGMTAVTSSPYSAINPRTPSPPRCRFSSRCSAPTRPPRAVTSNDRAATTDAGSAAVRCRRTARDAAENRVIARSCTGPSKAASPVASSRSVIAAPASPRLEGAAARQPAPRRTAAPTGLTQPGRAQRLHGGDQVQPPAQRRHAGRRDGPLGAGRLPPANSPSPPAHAASSSGVDRQTVSSCCTDSSARPTAAAAAGLV